MEDSDVLRRLLKIEAEAAGLVKDAAMEADKRIAEAEKQNRQRYDDAYVTEAAALEEKYKAAIASVNIEYQKQLDDFTQSLNVMKTDRDNFSRLLESLLFERCDGEEKKEKTTPADSIKKYENRRET